MIKEKVRFIILFIFLSADIAYGIQISIANKNTGLKKFIAGDLIQVVFKVSFDQKNLQNGSFLNFLDTKELGPFTIIDQKSQAIQELAEINGKEKLVISIDLDLVLRDEVESKNDLYFIYNKTKIPIRLEGLDYQFKGIDPKIKIVEIDLKKDSVNGLVLKIILILIFFLITFLVSIHLKKRKVFKVRKKQREEILNLLKDIHSRECLENLYKKRYHWEKYVQKELRDSFYAVINHYQYKQDWTSLDLEEVSRVAKRMEPQFYD